VAAPKIPVVFMFGLDPVKHGLVASIERPGGNATGVFLLAGGLEARRLQLVRDLLPDVDLVAALINPDNPNAASHARDLAAAARAWRLKLLTLEARNDDDFEPAFMNMLQQLAGALIVTSDPFFDSRRQQLVASIARTRMPTIYPTRDFVEAGGLMSYGPSLTEGARRVGLYAGRILRGVKPADLPVWIPSTFDLVVNLRAAAATRVTIPPAILARADEVIE
jgi:putative ABC transport system substrate-binding protein